MKFLLDTHILLWALTNDERLPKDTREIIADRRHDVFVSSASIWELAIKQSLGKIPATDLYLIERAILDTGFTPLEITIRHASEVTQLPPHHRDPFDRMLIAQAISEGARLITHDVQLSKYGATVQVV